MSYEKWKDDELLKARKRNWIKLVRNEFYTVAFFGLALPFYLAAKNEMWWLLCGGAGLVAFLFFIYSLCAVAARADDVRGIR